MLSNCITKLVIRKYDCFALISDGLDGNLCTTTKSIQLQQNKHIQLQLQSFQ